MRSIITNILILGVITSKARPVSNSSHQDRENQIFAEKYLLRFGYYSDSSSGKTSSLQAISKAVAQFQAFAGLDQTGQIDAATVELMRERRCGVKDSVQARRKRFALQGSRWRKRNITYRVGKYPSKAGLSRKDVDTTMKKAFEVWSRSTNLNFERKSVGDVHIEISFEEKDHGDDDPFDGIGGTLAHAFFPVYGGDVHFDEEENWTVNTFRGTSLLMSATHELGHSLGLSHSDVKDSMMAPFYRGFQPNIKLHADDIRGIQELYGEKVTKTNIKQNKTTVNPVTFFPVKSPPFTTPSTIATTSSSTSPSRSTTFTTTPSSISTTQEAQSTVGQDEEERKHSQDICQSIKLDSMITDKNGDTYAFQGSSYWKLTDTSVEPGYPRPISEGWEGLPQDIDAAFTWTNGKTYFIKDSLYWRFSEVGILDAGYPRNFSEAFAGVPTDVDAAMVWPVNKKIYFFKGDKYWKFDPAREPSVDSSYPRPLQNWEGVPDNLDSAMLYSNNKTYFFKQGNYFRCDNQRGGVDDTAEPEYPKDTVVVWLQGEECSS